MEIFTLYTKNGCPWCVDAVDWLRRKGYRFTEVDVSRDRSAFAKMKEISGQTRAPTLAVSDKVLPDFDIHQLEAFLVKHNLLP